MRISTILTMTLIGMTETITQINAILTTMSIGTAEKTMKIKKITVWETKRLFYITKRVDI